MSAKYVTVNQMVAKDSVRIRMAGEHGISFTEFSYMLLQAFDYWWQYENFACRLQIGGSDQWGNITAGIDLVRKRSGATVHGLTWPLMTKADGSKFGKTADGALWLNADRTLPYELYQYLLQTDDKDVERLLMQLTMLPIATVKELIAKHDAAPHQRQAQQTLAREVCIILHGPAVTQSAELATKVLFGTDTHITEDSLAAIQGIVPETQVSATSVCSTELAEPIVDALVISGLCTSRSDARRSLQGGSVRVNGKRISNTEDSVELIADRFALIQRGRKRYHLLSIVPS